MDSNAKSTVIGNAACFCAYLIFGFNIIFSKNVADFGQITPLAIYLMRAIGALALFWFASIFGPHDKMDWRDLWKVAIASFLGLFMTQLSFLKAITMTTALDASILSLLSPIMTMIVAAIFLKDKISLRGVIGLTISFCGVLFLVLNTVSVRTGAAHTTIGGILLLLVNTLSFASYVGIFKPLIKKYSVVTFMKWMFLFSTLYGLPFGLKDLMNVEFAAIPARIVLQLLFMVVCATFVSYFLIPVGQKRLKPMLVSMYSYVQPVVAMCISLAYGLDTMSWSKAAATLLVFFGVTLVNFSGKMITFEKPLKH